MRAMPWDFQRPGADECRGWGHPCAGSTEGLRNKLANGAGPAANLKQLPSYHNETLAWTGPIAASVGCSYAPCSAMSSFLPPGRNSQRAAGVGVISLARLLVVGRRTARLLPGARDSPMAAPYAAGLGRKSLYESHALQDRAGVAAIPSSDAPGRHRCAGGGGSARERRGRSTDCCYLVTPGIIQANLCRLGRDWL